MPVRRSVLTIVAAAAGAVVLASCGPASGGGPGEAGEARGGGAGVTADAAGQEEALLEFVRCMRAEGVEMPDPQPGPGGAVVAFKSEFGAPEQGRWEAAHRACKRHLEKAGLAHQPPSAAELETRQEQMLAFARCMRSEGIDMPDPQVGPGGTTSFQFPMSGLAAAEIDAIQRRCSKKAGMDAPVMVQGPRS